MKYIEWDGRGSIPEVGEMYVWPGADSVTVLFVYGYTGDGLWVCDVIRPSGRVQRDEFDFVMRVKVE